MTETTALQDRTNTPVSGSGKPAGKSTRKPGYISAREHAHKTLSNIDKDFKGKEETIGVIGVPSEGNLTHGVDTPDEFYEAIMNHAGSKFDGGADLKPLLENEECPLAALEAMEPKFPEAVEVTKKNEKGNDEKVMEIPAGKKYRYDLELKEFLYRLRTCEHNRNKVYEIMRGQVTPTLLQEIKGRKDYDAEHRKSNALWLMKTIRSIASGIDDKNNKFYTYTTKVTDFMSMRQGPVETLDDWMKRLRGAGLALDDCGGKAVSMPDILNYPGTDIEKKEQFMAMMFFMYSDKYRFGAKIRKLQEDMEEGNDNYPETLRSAYDMLVKVQARWIEDNKRHTRRTGLSFYQGEENKENQCLVCGTDGLSYPGITCYHCKKEGHYKRQCPSLKGVKKVSALTYGYVMHNKLSAFYLKDSIFLLDCGATHSTVNNGGFMTNLTICNKEDVLCTITNTGSTIDYDRNGRLSFLPLDVHLNEDSIANILAFHAVNSIPNAHLYFNGSREDAMFLVFKSGRVVKFKRCEIGLYFYDAENPEEHEFQCSATFVQTARSKAQVLSKEDKHRAKLAQTLQEYLRWPSSAKFKRILDDALVKTDAKVEDVDLAESDLGLPEPIAKGKLIRKSPKSHADDYYVLPEKWRGMVENLYVDVMKVAGIPFLLSKSGKIKGLKAYSLTNEKLDTMTEVVLKDMNRYKKRGFVIGKVHGDNAFNKEMFKEAVRPSVFEAYTANEHVGMVERDIRTMKEQSRCTANGKPYKKVPLMMIVDLVEGTTDMISDIGRKGGLSDTIAPNSIINGTGRLDLTKNFIGWGCYAQVWTGTDNTMGTRSVDAVALRRSNNEGGFYFLNLETGKRIHSNQWTELPITQKIIERVEMLAENGATMEDVLEQLKHEPQPNEVVETEKVVRFQEDDVSEDIVGEAVVADDRIQENVEIQEAFSAEPIVSDVESTSSEEEDFSKDVVSEEDVSSKEDMQYEGSSFEYESSYEEEMMKNMNAVLESVETQEDDDDDTVFTKACKDACRELKALIAEHLEKPGSDNKGDNAFVENVIDELKDDYDDAVAGVTQAFTVNQVIFENVEPGDEDEVKGSTPVGSNAGEVRGSSPVGCNAEEVRGSSPDDSSAGEVEGSSPVDNVTANVRRSERLAGKVSSDGLKSHTDLKDYGRSTVPDSKNVPYGSKSTMKKIGFTNMQTSYAAAAKHLLVKTVTAYNPCFVSAKLQKSRTKALEKPKEDQDQFTRIVNSVFAQMPALKGFKEFGEAAVEVMIKEFEQLDKGAIPGKPVVVPVDPDVLSQEAKNMALDAVNLVELKRDGKTLEGRTCANGSKQRMYLKEYESVASPTVMLEGLYGMLLIGAYEKRKHISFDVPGAFLQAPSPDDKMMLLKLKGRFVDLMCEVNPAHKANVLYEVTKSGKQQKVLYMKVVRTLYGCIEAVLQWYVLFSETLEKEGFVLNPYDKSVANKMVNDKQCSIAWHVDDCMMNHLEDAVLEDCIPFWVWILLSMRMAESRSIWRSKFRRP